MERLFDEKVKKLFKTLKALMFWPHPEEYKKYMVAFNMRENELIEEFKSIPEEKIKDMAEELNSSIQDFPLSIYVETTSDAILDVLCALISHHKELKGKCQRKCS